MPDGNTVSAAEAADNNNILWCIRSCRVSCTRPDRIRGTPLPSDREGHSENCPQDLRYPLPDGHRCFHGGRDSHDDLPQRRMSRRRRQRYRRWFSESCSSFFISCFMISDAPSASLDHKTICFPNYCYNKSFFYKIFILSNYRGKPPPSAESVFFSRRINRKCFYQMKNGSKNMPK